tara:strand:- start:442 stop:1095 length:654 start_codon:yes stop_codon:yes gene_type:complete
MAAQLKICGLMQPPQAAAVAQLGADAIGVIAARPSARFLSPERRPALWQAVAQSNPGCRRVLVVVNPSDDELESLRPEQGHQLLQLHGEETPERCQQLREELGLPLWKALRIRSAADLQRAAAYSAVVDGLLLDAWSATAHGGTGERLPLQWLQGFQPELPWWLAGGIGPSNARQALDQLAQQDLRPTGLDASSGVEQSPGLKDLQQVEALVKAVRG